MPFNQSAVLGSGVSGRVGEGDAVDDDGRGIDVGDRHEVGRRGRRAEDEDLQVGGGGRVDAEGTERLADADLGGDLVARRRDRHCDQAALDDLGAAGVGAIKHGRVFEVLPPWVTS